MHVLRDTAHAPTIERPGAFSAAVVPFLTSLSDSDRRAAGRADEDPCPRDCR
jgi:hypothetical protein